MTRTVGLSWVHLSLFTVMLVATATRAHGQAAKKLTIPAPQPQTVDAAGFQFHFTYYQGGFIQKSGSPVEAKPGKEVVPIIMLHGYQGFGADFHPLAASLQQMGHAVVVPDLRGHGASKIRTPNGADFPVDKLAAQHFDAMVGDLEIIKRFLYEKNNAGQLNVEMLCLLGADLGGLVATNWVMMDWSRRDLPAYRQGKSAKALIVLSPTPNLKGYTASDSWKHSIFHTPAWMSIMLVAGSRDSRSFKELRQIQRKIENNHQVDPAATDRSRQSLWLVEPDTDLAGTNLVNPKFKLPVAQQINQFITLRLANRQADFPWSERKSPLEAAN